MKVRSIPLGEAPYRLAYQEATGTIMVATHMEGGAGGPVIGHLKLIDCTSFDVRDNAFQLKLDACYLMLFVL